jgi:hypothetical protein
MERHGAVWFGEIRQAGEAWRGEERCGQDRQAIFLKEKV